MNILIYALGGGWGHITRAAALARALTFTRVRILANSPYLPIVKTAMPELWLEAVSTYQEMVTRIEAMQPDVLIVDTFPRGLGGELADVLRSLPAWKILIHRDLKPEYVRWANLRRFVAAHYDLVLCPGESGPLANLDAAQFTAPWLIRPPVAVEPAIDVVVCASGNAVESAWYGAVAARLSPHCGLRCLAAELPEACPPELWMRYWPSLDWIAAARVVVGGAGYNTVNECLALSVPLIAHPWPRKYDRQQRRAEECPNVTIVGTPEEAAGAVLEALARHSKARHAFKNGAEEAAESIRRLVYSQTDG